MQNSIRPRRKDTECLNRNQSAPTVGRLCRELLDGEKVVKFTLPLTVKAFARIGGSGLPERTPVINPSPPKIKIQSTSADILRKKITSIFQAARGVNDGIAGIRPGDSIAESRLWRPFKVTSYYPEVAVSGSTVVLEGTTLNAVPSELFFGETNFSRLLRPTQ